MVLFLPPRPGPQVRPAHAGLQHQAAGAGNIGSLVEGPRRCLLGVVACQCGSSIRIALGGQMFRYGTTTLAANTWYHVTGVYNAATSELHVYLNGQLDDGQLIGTVTASQQNSTVNVNIGQRLVEQVVPILLGERDRHHDHPLLLRVLLEAPDPTAQAVGHLGILHHRAP